MAIKRFVCLFLACFLLLSACTYNTDNSDEKIPEPNQYAHAVYGIIITTKCISNDSVGNEWVKSYSMDGQEVSSGAQITLPLSEPPITKTITAKIEECDKHPDISSQDITFMVKEGERKAAMITVTEDGGCYKGNEAVWEVVVSVELIEKLEQL